MKVIARLALAGLIAATSVTTTTAAYAGGNHWKKNYNHGKQYKHGNNNSNGWNPGAALATGAFLGLAFGALAAPSYNYRPPVYAYTPPPPPPPPYPAQYSYNQYNNQHVGWCSAKYRSYNVRNNTWIGYDGYIHQCVSPYY